MFGVESVGDQHCGEQGKGWCQQSEACMPPEGQPGKYKGTDSTTAFRVHGRLQEWGTGGMLLKSSYQK